MRESGYTLIEVLIMLAITAILAATVLETVRFATSNAIRIERAARSATGELIDMAALRRAISNTRTDYMDSDHGLNGDARGFRAQTSYPIVSDSSAMQPYTLELRTQGNSLNLVYGDPAGEFIIERWSDAEGDFSYLADHLELVETSVGLGNPRPIRQWQDRWITDQEARRAGHAAPQPLAIKLDISTPSGSFAYIYPLPAVATPPIRPSDLIGESPL